MGLWVNSLCVAYNTGFSNAHCILLKNRILIGKKVIGVNEFLFVISWDVSYIEFYFNQKLWNPFSFLYVMPFELVYRTNWCEPFWWALTSNFKFIIYDPSMQVTWTRNGTVHFCSSWNYSVHHMILLQLVNMSNNAHAHTNVFSHVHPHSLLYLMRTSNCAITKIPTTLVCTFMSHFLRSDVFLKLEGKKNLGKVARFSYKRTEQRHIDLFRATAAKKEWRLVSWVDFSKSNVWRQQRHSLSVGVFFSSLLTNWSEFPVWTFRLWKRKRFFMCKSWIDYISYVEVKLWRI